MGNLNFIFILFLFSYTQVHGGRADHHQKGGYDWPLRPRPQDSHSRQRHARDYVFGNVETFPEHDELILVVTLLRARLLYLRYGCKTKIGQIQRLTLKKGKKKPPKKKKKKKKKK